jgi:hypothetical protein
MRHEEFSLVLVHAHHREQRGADRGEDRGANSCLHAKFFAGRELLDQSR